MRAADFRRREVHVVAIEFTDTASLNIISQQLAIVTKQAADLALAVQPSAWTVYIAAVVAQFAMLALRIAYNGETFVRALGINIVWISVIGWFLQDPVGWTGTLMSASFDAVRLAGIQMVNLDDVIIRGFQSGLVIFQQVELSINILEMSVVIVLSMLAAISVLYIHFYAAFLTFKYQCKMLFYGALSPLVLCFMPFERTRHIGMGILQAFPTALIHFVATVFLVRVFARMIENFAITGDNGEMSTTKAIFILVVSWGGWIMLRAGQEVADEIVRGTMSPESLPSQSQGARRDATAIRRATASVRRRFSGRS